MSGYHAFLESRMQLDTSSGFEPSRLPKQLFPFQRSLAEWAIRRGRAAIFADCGLGKTLMQFAFADNVVRKTNRPFLFLTTLGDSFQTVQEAEKFGFDAVRSKDGTFPLGARIVVANYERLHLFNYYRQAVQNVVEGVRNFDAHAPRVATLPGFDDAESPIEEGAMA